MAYERSIKLAKILEAAKINATSVKVFGPFAHIDTFHKYENQICDLMGRAGFKLRSTRDGIHLDNYTGFRMVFEVK
jgi:hypothetical protein